MPILCAKHSRRRTVIGSAPYPFGIVFGALLVTIIAVFLSSSEAVLVYLASIIVLAGTSGIAWLALNGYPLISWAMLVGLFAYLLNAATVDATDRKCRLHRDIDLCSGNFGKIEAADRRLEYASYSISASKKTITTEAIMVPIFSIALSLIGGVQGTTISMLSIPLIIYAIMLTRKQFSMLNEATTTINHLSQNTSFVCHRKHCRKTAYKTLQAIGGMVNNDNILSNLIFYSELVIHWALCNNVNVKDGSLGAIAKLRTISSPYDEGDNSHFEATIGAEDAFLSAGVGVGLEHNKADAIVADICLPQ